MIDRKTEARIRHLEQRLEDNAGAIERAANFLAELKAYRQRLKQEITDLKAGGLYRHETQLHTSEGQAPI